MSDAKEKLMEQTEGVLEKVYDDIARPSAKSIGNTLSLLPRTIGVWLGKWEKWITNGEESIRLAAKIAAEKAKQIPEEKLTEPEPYVAIPAIQQLSYCYDSKELRELYANLLVSSMNIDIKYQVHPAYVEIIKQLTPDEARLLTCLANNTEEMYPIIDIIFQKNDRKEFQNICNNFTTVAIEKLISKKNICSYMDNLERLKLIEISSNVRISDEEIYDIIFKHSFYLNTVATLKQYDGLKLSARKKVFYLTEFGRSFIKCVV